MRDTRSCDVQHGAKGQRITYASRSTDITPTIGWGPDLTEKHGDDVDDVPAGDVVYPKNGTGKDDPAG